MALITSVAGFATFGVAARAFALNIQRRPIVSGKLIRRSPTYRHAWSNQEPATRERSRHACYRRYRPFDATNIFGPGR
jgi:hypothetical protein